MTTRYKNFLFYWLPILIYCLLIYIQSSYPSLEIVPKRPNTDKFLHFGAFAILGALFLRAFTTLRLRGNITLLMILCVLLSALYGISDEIHQYYVPYRSADLMDVLADIAGSILGVYVYYLFAIRYRICLHKIPILTKLRFFFRRFLGWIVFLLLNLDEVAKSLL